MTANTSGLCRTAATEPYGAAALIRTAGDHNSSRLAEFLMRGGTIRGNFNNVQTAMANGGGIQVSGVIKGVNLGIQRLRRCRVPNSGYDYP